MHQQRTMNTAVFASLLILGLAPVACGDDADGVDDTGGSSSAAADDSSVATDSLDTLGTTGVTGVDSTGAPSSTGPGDSSGDSDGSSTGDPVVGDWGALVLGTLYTDDLAMAQATHDAVAMGGQAGAMAAGDFGHDALLGTALLGTTPDAFLGIDQWDNLDGALAVYGDPDFQAAFAMLFSRPPSVELFQKRDDWYGWGDLEAADAGDRWFVVIRGRLAESDLDAAQAMHDALAAGGEADATALGDVAHVVWVSTPEDAQQFFAVDVWTDDTSIEAFYGNPEFQMAFGTLFEAPPTVGVYASTDWHQW